MKGSIEQPKIFISYSWSTPVHEQWVLNLAERLSNDGIYVHLDKWDLKEGQDKHVFMEKMVNDENINKVLIICDKNYQQKADDRQGGVGTETQLISKEVYDNVEQQKFIPIIKECDENGNPSLPHFISSRIYIDLSSEEIYEENYNKLIRCLYNKPLFKRPSIGTVPSFIIEEEPTVLKTSHKVAEIKRAIMSNSKSADGLSYDYLNTFLSSLEDFRLTGGSATDFDEQVLSSIERMTALRDDFIDFTFTTFKYIENVDLEKFHDFFEQLLKYKFKPENVNTWTEVDFDNFKFFIYELLLYFITILLQLKKYKEVSYFVNSQYFYKYYEYEELSYSGIEIFNDHIASLDKIRNQRLNLGRVSITADLIKSRAIRKDISFGQLQQADMIIFYLTNLKGEGFAWFPRTAVYNKFGLRIDIFEKMVSKQHFDKIKILFDVNSIGELKNMINEYVDKYKNQPREFSNSPYHHIPPLEKVLNIKKIGKVK